MKIKILWGFVGNGALLGADSNKVKAGAVFEEANDEYAHTLIGKGLAVELGASGKSKATKPTTSKPAAPAENRSAGAAPENKDGAGAAAASGADPAQGSGEQADPATGAGND